MSLNHEKIDGLKKAVFWEIGQAHYWATGGNNLDQVRKHLRVAGALSDELAHESSIEKIMGRAP